MPEEPEVSSDPDEERKQKQKQKQNEEIRSFFRSAQEVNLSSWQQDVHSLVPRSLYHYTTSVGLTGILTSHSLWASDVRYMNDASELSYAAALIADEVGHVFGAVADAQLQPVLPNVQAFANIFEYGGLRPFCACLCEEGDLLSQWRGYTAGQIGYSLGLDLRLPNIAIDLPPNTFLRKVVYDECEQRSWVRRITETWLTAASTLLDSGRGLVPTDLFPYPAIWTLQEALAEQQLCFKNPGFSEEREWRLIKLVDIQEELRLVEHRLTQARLERLNETLEQQGIKSPPILRSWPRTNAEGIEIKFRQASMGFIPYIELRLKQRAGVFTDRLPLESVVQGPTPNVALAFESLAMYLRSFGFSMTQVGSSTIPLR